MLPARGRQPEPDVKDSAVLKHQQKQITETFDWVILSPFQWEENPLFAFDWRHVNSDNGSTPPGKRPAGSIAKWALTVFLRCRQRSGQRSVGLLVKSFFFTVSSLKNDFSFSTDSGTHVRNEPAADNLCWTVFSKPEVSTGTEQATFFQPTVASLFFHF